MSSVDDRMAEVARRRERAEAEQRAIQTGRVAAEARALALREVGNSEEFAEVLDEIAPLLTEAIEGCLKGKELVRDRAQGSYEVLERLLARFGRQVTHIIARPYEAQTRQPDEEDAE